MAVINNYPIMNNSIPGNSQVLGITAPTIHSNYQDIIDSYNDLQEIKNNSVAAIIANHRKNKKRASATAIGFTFGVMQGGFLTAVYGVAKSIPKLQKLPGISYIVKDLDKWIKKSKILHPNRGMKFHLTTGVLYKTSWLALSGAVLGFLADYYSTYRNTRVTGRISNTKQGKMGDSYLLSSLNSLANSESGKSIIKDAISVNNDNSINVKFKGINKEYNITRKELKDASRAYLIQMDKNGKVKNYSKKYSTGDGDVLALELAMEKYKNDLKSGIVKVDKSEPSYSSIVSNNLNCCSVCQVLYLLTGENASLINLQKDANTNLNALNLYSKKYFNNFMSDFSLKPDNYAAVCCFNIKDELSVNNKHHQKIKLNPYTNYSIKNINKKSVTIIDPQKSRVPIDIPIQTFKDIVGAISFVNISDKNNQEQPLQNYADLTCVNFS